MCGIFGAIGDDIKPGDIISLAKASQTRGSDATGLFISRFGEDNRLIKNNLPADVFVKDEIVPKSLEGAKLVIGHTRNYTTGSPNDNNNNHPLYGTDIVLVHNGVCNSTTRVKDYPYKAKVDSEIPLSLLETKGYAGLREIQGSAALAWSLIGDKVINLWRTNNPCCISKINNAFYFASTPEILKKAFGADIAVTDTEESYIYYVGFDKDNNLVFLRGKEKFAARGYTSWANQTSSSTVSKKYKLSVLVEESLASELVDVMDSLWGTIAKPDLSMVIKPDSKVLITVRNISDYDRKKIESTLKLIGMLPSIQQIDNSPLKLEESTLIPVKTSNSHMGI